MMMSMVPSVNAVSGFSSGLISSLTSSSIQLAKGGDALVIIGGGLSGGIGAAITGGNYWDGFRHGAIVAGFNHIEHLNSDYLVDSELEGLGLNPYSKADFTDASIKTIQKLPSQRKLIKMHKTQPKVKLGSDKAYSYYENGTINMYEKDFAQWRILATAYGHEYVHFILMKLHSQTLYESGYGRNKYNPGFQFPYWYNEALAHFWSSNYSGIGIEAFNTCKTNACNLYGRLYDTYFEAHKILP